MSPPSQRKPIDGIREAELAPPTPAGLVRHVPLARWLGLGQEQRDRAVARMLEDSVAPPAPYWLQIVIATGIATLGLALNSTGVVIGAMLVSPLMAPIVNFGGALAIGSAFLATRAMVRVAGSALAVVGLATVITWLLPFRELTPEILARTRPTALDMGVAIFCGIAAAYSGAKADSGTVSAATGTAIAIALVPPLCVVGFGIGAGHPEVWQGALMLFLANIASIVLMSLLFFTALGFEGQHVVALEASVLPERVRAGRQYQWLHAARLVLPARRSQRILRFGLPVMFVAVIFVPLRQALSEVAWEVRARASIQHWIRDARERYDVIEVHSDARDRRVEIGLTLVGEPQEAEDLTRLLVENIGPAVGARPDVEVRAVSKAEARLPAVRESAPAIHLPPTVPESLAVLRGAGAKAMAEIWPEGTAGKPLRWELRVGGDEAVLAVVRVAATPLSPETVEALERAATRPAGTRLRLEEVRIPDVVLDVGAEGPLPDAAELRRLADAALREPALDLRVTTPSDEAIAALRPAGAARAAARRKADLLAALAELPEGRVAREESPDPRFRVLVRPRAAGP